MEDGDVATAQTNELITKAPTGAPIMHSEDGFAGPLGMVAGMLLLLFLLLRAKPVHLPIAVPPPRFNPYRSAPHRETGQIMPPPSDRNDSAEETPELRTERIDSSLRVQRVVSIVRDITTLGAIEVDEEGVPSNGDYTQLSESVSPTRLTKSKRSQHPSDYRYSSMSATTETTDGMDDPNPMTCCCICLESYRVGDIVAWSGGSTCRRSPAPHVAPEAPTASVAPINSVTEANISATVNATPSCLHVFHRKCIVQWLEHPLHDDCPSCRTVLLQPPPPIHQAHIAETTIQVDDDEVDCMDSQHEKYNYDAEQGIEMSEGAHELQSDTLSSSNAINPTAMAVAAGTASSPLGFVIINGLIARVRRNQQRQHRWTSNGKSSRCINNNASLE
jgi:Ring finger domain